MGGQPAGRREAGGEAMNFRVLGYIMVALAVIASSPYWVARLNKWTFKTRDPRYIKLLKFLRNIHKPIGVLLLIGSLIHGYQAYRLNPHTGFVVFLSFLAAVLLGGKHYSSKKKNPKVFKAHKIMVLVSFALLLIHLLWPSALGQLFGIWGW
jgi:hypothetical protein